MSDPSTALPPKLDQCQKVEEDSWASNGQSEKVEDEFLEVATGQFLKVFFGPPPQRFERCKDCLVVKVIFFVIPSGNLYYQLLVAVVHLGDQDFGDIEEVFVACVSKFSSWLIHS